MGANISEAANFCRPEDKVMQNLIRISPNYLIILVIYFNTTEQTKQIHFIKM